MSVLAIGVSLVACTSASERSVGDGRATPELVAPHAGRAGPTASLAQQLNPQGLDSSRDVSVDRTSSADKAPQVPSLTGTASPAGEEPNTTDIEPTAAQTGPKATDRSPRARPSAQPTAKPSEPVSTPTPQVARLPEPQRVEPGVLKPDRSPQRQSEKGPGGQPTEAGESFENCRDLASVARRHFEAYTNAHSINPTIRRADLEAARETYWRAYRFCQGTALEPAALYSLGMVNFVRGHYDDARRYFSSLKRITDLSGYPSAQEFLELLAARANHKECRGRAGHLDQYRLAVILEMRRLTEEAEDAFEKVTISPCAQIRDHAANNQERLSRFNQS